MESFSRTIDVVLHYLITTEIVTETKNRSIDTINSIAIKLSVCLSLVKILS